MNTKIPRRYLLIPAVYILLIAALLAVELTGTVRVQEHFANITLSAVLPARQRGNSRTVYQVDLEMDGFVLSFDRQKPLEFRLSSGRSLYTALSAYALLPGAIEIEFGDHFRLLLHTGSGNENRVELITDFDEAAELVMPYSSSGPVTISEQAGLPLITIVQNSSRGASVTTAVALPPQSTIDLVNGAFIFRNDASGYADFYISRFESVKTVSPSYWFEIQYDFPLVGSYDGNLESYLDRVYRGWTVSRYSKSSGTWNMPDGSAGFDESLLVAALSESVEKGTFVEVLSALRNSTVLFQDAISWLSAPHIGDIVNKGAQIQSADLELIQAVRSQISNNDLTVFSIPGLLSFARDRAPSPLFQELADFAARVRIADANMEKSLSMLETYLASLAIDDPLTEAFERFRPLIDDAILSSLSLTDRGLVLLTQIGRADVLSSIRAGSILMGLSVIEENVLYERIGKELIGAAIAQGDEDGALPATLLVADRIVTGTTGHIAPENLFSLLTEPRYYPHQVSLADPLGAGSWAWTSSENFEVRDNGTSATISFEYPKGGTHHFAVKGIKPFSRITFYGTLWKSDPRFQFYRTGWLYDQTAETLYVKITHNDPKEELVISY